MEVILLLVYLFAGDQANQYLKYHILNVRAEVYSDTNDFILSRLIWAGVLGWATVPIAILHKIFFNSGGDGK